MAADMAQDEGARPPKVSFVLPAYKRRFLNEAMDSILAQTYRDFELVVVDDNSPEGLYEAIKEQPWEKTGASLPSGGKTWTVGGIAVRYYRNAENIGGRDLVAAWNHAIGHAKGEWCVLASDDDVYAPTFLERMVELSERHPDVDLVHSCAKIIDADGRIIGASPPKREVESAIELAHRRIAGRADQFVAEFMFRRSRLEEIGGFVRFPKAWYSDEATWMLLAERGCANCNDPLFSFRHSGENITTSLDRIFDLVEAGVQYFGWAGKRLSSMIPSDELDAFFLEDAKAKLERRVVGLIRVQMSQTTPREWIRVVARSAIPWKWKVRCIIDLLKKAARLGM